MTNRQYIYQEHRIPRSIWKWIAPHTSVIVAPSIQFADLPHGAEYDHSRGAIIFDTAYFFRGNFGAFASTTLHECVHREQYLRWGRFGFWWRYKIFKERIEKEADDRALLLVPEFSPENSLLMDCAYIGD